MSGEDVSNGKPPEPEKPLFATIDFSKAARTEKMTQPDPIDATLKIDGSLFLDIQNNSTVPAPTADEWTSDSFPTDIPGFRIEREIGRGAFGVVFAAHDEMLDRKIAIKKPIISDPAHRQQYIDEARKAVKLEHPGIVPIYHVGMTTNSEPFVVQKLIEGSSLRGLLRSSEGRLPIVQIVSILRQICLAVDAAHTAGIVHRDLKPENLLVEPDGRVYVADFGLAIIEDDEQGTRRREVVGTPFYMSPEQFAGRNEWLDGRSDIWALGVILYELLSGKTPFTGITVSELKDEIRNKDPRPLHQRDHNIPAEFDALFRKCCAKQVADRFASVHEMLVELDKICEALTLNLFEWETRSKSGLAVSQTARSGSIFDTARDSLTGRGLTTQRSMSSTTRRTMRDSIFAKPRMYWSFIGPVVTTVVTLTTVVYGAWYMKLGPFAEVRAIPLLSESSLVPSMISPPAKESNSPENAIPVVPVIPEKPFVVSIKGGGTHASIAQAIADSAAGETITVQEGTYRESIILDRSLSIVGEGDVKIMALDKGCVEIRGDSQVSFQNVNFDCQVDAQNSIDIYGGKLQLTNCDVFVSSKHAYDCIRVRSNAFLAADQCNFQSTEHAAIYGDQDSTMATRDCKISFPGNVDYGLKRGGVQATGSTGLIRNCKIVGPCISAIDWMDSPDKSLLVEQCQLENFDSFGIQVKRCGNVRIIGTLDEPCQIRNTPFGINVVESQVELEFVNVASSDAKSKVGLQITKGSLVQCREATFAGMQCGVLIHQSRLDADRIGVQDTNFTGILVDDSNINAKEVRIFNIREFGLAVLSTNSRVAVTTLKIDAQASTGQKTASAIYATSGEVEFEQAEFQSCLSAITVDPGRRIIDDVGYNNKSTLAELLRDRTQGSGLPLPQISGDKLELLDCDHAWTFTGAGTSRIKEIIGDISNERLAPLLVPLDDTSLKIEGDDFSDFVVRPSLAEK